MSLCTGRKGTGLWKAAGSAAVDRCTPGADSMKFEIDYGSSVVSIMNSSTRGKPLVAVKNSFDPLRIRPGWVGVASSEVDVLDQGWCQPRFIGAIEFEPGGVFTGLEVHVRTDVDELGRVRAV